MHYSKQNTTDSTSVNASLALLGHQTSHSLQSLCFIPCNAIYYFITPLLNIWLLMPVARVGSCIFNPRQESWNTAVIIFLIIFFFLNSRCSSKSLLQFAPEHQSTLYTRLVPEVPNLTYNWQLLSVKNYYGRKYPAYKAWGEHNSLNKPNFTMLN